MASSILEAGEAVFAEQGLHSARMEDIAGSAGVAVGTLYNYFADRKALLCALVDSRRDELLQRVDQALVAAEQLPFRKQLEMFMMAVFQHFESHRQFFVILMEAEGAHLTTAKPRDSVRELYARCRAIVTRGIASGDLRNDTLVDYAAMLNGCLRAVFARGQLFGDPIDPSEEQAAALVDFFLRGAGRSD